MEDATPGDGNVNAFVTANCEGSECDSAAFTDVDGGPTFLISPPIDLEGTNGIVSDARWFFSSGNDTLNTPAT